MVPKKINILTPLQKEFLHLFGEEDKSEYFYLTGGTALSAFYLYHRYSEDMYFFTSVEGVMPLLRSVLEKIANIMNAKIEIKRTFATFLECIIRRDEHFMPLHFANDTPYRLSPLYKEPNYKVWIDSELDIACNKLSALFDRQDIKDFVDVYFLSKEFMDFWKIYKNAKDKHIGIEEYWLAVGMRKIFDIETLPRMIKPVTLEELKDFYKVKIHALMNRIQKGEIG